MGCAAIFGLLWSPTSSKIALRDTKAAKTAAQPGLLVKQLRAQPREKKISN